MASLSSLEHTAIGACAGLTERPAGSIAPITAVQFGAHSLLISGFANNDLSAASRIGVASAAGVASAFVSAPAELVMIQQQKHGRPLLTELQHIVKQHGLKRLYRGMTMTMAREGIYTASYLGVCPTLCDYLQGTDILRDQSPTTSFLISGCTAGLLAAVATQPADTIKTRMQAFIDSTSHPQYQSVASSAQAIASSQGYRGLWLGLAPRAFRLVGATFILNKVRTGIIDLVEHQRSISQA
ncbi:hypothetical protein WJX74_005393 [Apatococcus lobatus]|uniref:Uncharacterized protein n=1 Tax=Apatococcus lobatus TaxID=904363 RepID=A0AAW1RHT5_9CHLO